MSEVISNNVKSPLTHDTDVTLQKVISTDLLCKEYKKRFNIDVDYIFEKLEYIYLYKCNATGYFFYYPYHISGDDRFYAQLSYFDWYYLPWKREHEEGQKYISDNDKILEVGAARGDFLKRIKTLRNVECVGLELNSKAIKEVVDNKVKLINQSVEDHASQNGGLYDVVCSFQVLEHISNVREVIKSMIDCLKPGGKLIISVPNNDSFIKYNPLPSKILNMPPHHMGLWNHESLSKLCNIFPLKRVEIKTEALERPQMDTYQYIMVKRILFNSEILTRIYWKLRIYILMRPLIMLLAPRIKGHSIMSVYTKI